jgi:hypothetical protein
MRNHKCRRKLPDAPVPHRRIIYKKMRKYKVLGSILGFRGKE